MAINSFENVVSLELYRLNEASSVKSLISSKSWSSSKKEMLYLHKNFGCLVQRRPLEIAEMAKLSCVDVSKVLHFLYLRRPLFRVFIGWSQNVIKLKTYATQTGLGRKKTDYFHSSFCTSKAVSIIIDPLYTEAQQLQPLVLLRRIFGSMYHYAMESKWFRARYYFQFLHVTKLPFVCELVHGIASYKLLGYTLRGFRGLLLSTISDTLCGIALTSLLSACPWECESFVADEHSK